MIDLSTVLQTLTNGMAAGTMYGLVAMGISLIYRTTRVTNFAQGHLAALAAFIGWTLYTQRQWPYALVVVVTACLIGILMLAVERIAIRRLYGAHDFFPIISTLGLSFAIEGVIVLGWGATGKSFPSVLGNEPITLGSIILVPERLWIAVIGLIITLSVVLFLGRTKMGLAMRSAAQAPLVAHILGIPVIRTYQVAFFASGALAALAGLLIAPVTYMTPTMGLNLAILGFVAAIIGGFGSVGGALVGGLVLGVIQNGAIVYVSSTYQPVIAYVLLFILVLIRPTGLFGEEGLSVREV